MKERDWVSRAQPRSRPQPSVAVCRIQLIEVHSGCAALRYTSGVSMDLGAAVKEAALEM